MFYFLFNNLLVCSTDTLLNLHWTGGLSGFFSEGWAEVWLTLREYESKLRCSGTFLGDVMSGQPVTVRDDLPCGVKFNVLRLTFPGTCQRTRQNRNHVTDRYIALGNKISEAEMTVKPLSCVVNGLKSGSLYPGESPKQGPFTC